MTRIIDYQDRATCILFGDGAGAMLVEPCGPDEQELGFIDFLGEIDGSGGEFLHMPAGGSRLPASAETVARRQHYVHQEGQQVFKYAVRKMQEVCETLLERNGFTGKDLQFLIPHQANRRIIDATVEKLGLSYDQVVINIDRYGNTTGRNHRPGGVRCLQRRAAEEGRPDPVCRRRRRLYRRRVALALGDLAGPSQICGVAASAGTVRGPVRKALRFDWVVVCCQMKEM